MLNNGEHLEDFEIKYGQDAINYHKHLHNVDHPPRSFLVLLPIERPEILSKMWRDPENADNCKWPIELN